MSTLDFNKIVKEVFSYLILQFHFVLSYEEVNTVSYENNEYIICFTFEDRSFSILTDIEAKNKKEKFSLFELMQVVSNNKSNEVNLQATNNDILKRCLQKIKDVFDVNFRFVLNDDIIELNKILPKLNENRKAYTEKFQYGAIKEKANIAWETKNYKEAYNLYNSIKNNLTEKEKRRYNYLKNK